MPCPHEAVPGAGVANQSEARAELADRAGPGRAGGRQPAPAEGAHLFCEAISRERPALPRRNWGVGGTLGRRNGEVKVLKYYCPPRLEFICTVAFSSC